MDLENNVKLPNQYHGMVTPGFAKGTDGSSWGWTVFPAHAAVWTNSTEPASCALLHEGGQNPCPNLALNFIFALNMHIKRVKKPGWKQRKEGCSPKNGRSCCLLSGQAGEGFATCRGNKAKLHPSLPAMGVMETAILGLNWTTLTACGYFLYNQEKSFSSRGSTSGSCSEVWAWRCASTFTVEHKFHRKPLLQNFKPEKPGNNFSAGSCRTGRVLLKSLLKQWSPSCCSWGSQKLGAWSI